MKTLLSYLIPSNSDPPEGRCFLAAWCVHFHAFSVHLQSNTHVRRCLWPVLFLTDQMTQYCRFSFFSFSQLHLFNILFNYSLVTHIKNLSSFLLLQSNTAEYSSYVYPPAPWVICTGQIPRSETVGQNLCAFYISTAPPKCPWKMSQSSFLQISMPSPTSSPYRTLTFLSIQWLERNLTWYLLEF